MLFTHFAIVHPDIDAIDISHSTIAMHQSGTDGNFAGQKARPDKDWNQKFIGPHPVGNVPTSPSPPPPPQQISYNLN